jgi:F0F1-type ATP synthase assembly protein I
MQVLLQIVGAATLIWLLCAGVNAVVKNARKKPESQTNNQTGEKSDAQ